MKVAFLGLKKNNSGQFAVEAVLLMSVLVGLFLALTNYAREKQLVQNLVQKPIERVGRMAAFGTWNKDCVAPGKAKLSPAKCHPNSIARALSSDPSK